MTGNPDVKVETKLEKHDISLGRKLASQRHHPLVKRLAGIGKLGDQEPLYAMGYAALFIGLFQNKRTVAEASVSALVAVAIADLGKQAIKAALKRTRPEEFLENGKYALEAGGSEKKESQSFPSGHVACTSAACIAVSTVWTPALAPSLAATVIVGLARW